MSAGSLNILVRAMLKGGSAGARANIQHQLSRIHDLYVRVRVVIDPQQVRQAVQGTRVIEDQYRGIQTQAQQVTTQTKKHTQNVQRTGKHLTAQTHQWNKIAQEMGVIEQLGIALKRIPVWMIGMTAFYAPLRSLRQGIEDIYEIDTQLTNFRKVADGTAEDFQNFAFSAAEMGKELGAMTHEVIQVSTEFARLGYTMEESANLAKEAMLLANVGVMEMEQATRSLIAMVQGFGVEIDQQGRNVRQVVDMVNY